MQGMWEGRDVEDWPEQEGLLISSEIAEGKELAIILGVCNKISSLGPVKNHWFDG